MFMIFGFNKIKMKTKVLTSLLGFCISHSVCVCVRVRVHPQITHINPFNHAYHCRFHKLRIIDITLKNLSDERVNL